MKIDYISDLHIDFWFEKEKALTEEVLKISYIHKNIFHNAEGEILLIAGDLGHYNHQNIEFLELLLKVYGYKHIFFVLGNHDYYTIAKERERFKADSSLRIKELKDMLLCHKNITLLDGQICDYQGIKIGGCGMWYDGRYAQQLNLKLSSEALLELWQTKMMDAIHINISDFIQLYNEEIIKLRNIYDKSDIILTHINPSISPSHTLRKYTLDVKNGFYSFNGEYYVQNSHARWWIFGHIHQSLEYTIGTTKVKANPLGYPHENTLTAKLKSFEFKKEDSLL